MLNTLFGLPTHALVVHAVVVLLPLATVGALGVALVPWLRRRYGELVALLTLVAVASVPIATQSGEQLYRQRSAQFGPGDDAEAGLMERHADLGGSLLPWAVVLLAGVLLVVLPPLLVRRRAARVPAPAGGGEGAAGPADRPGWTAPVALAGVVVTLVGAVMTAVLVIRIGHLGSEATWQRVTAPAATGAAPG